MLSEWFTNWLWWWDWGWGVLWGDLKSWIKYSFWWDFDAREAAWKKLKADIVRISNYVVDLVEHYATIVTDNIEEWATGIIGHVEEGASTIVARIESLWGSIGGVWAQFGANMLTENLTVEQWIDQAFDKASKWATQAWKDVVADVDSFYNWVIDWGNDASVWVNEKGDEVWEWINEKANDVWDWFVTSADAAWEWISEKADDVWDWIIGIGANVETWYDEQHSWLSDLYTNKRTELGNFLDDPGRYIADWVVDSLEYIVSECVFRFW